MDELTVQGSETLFKQNIFWFVDHLITCPARGGGFIKIKELLGILFSIKTNREIFSYEI